MTFNTTAASLIKHGHARPVEVPECIDLLQAACAHNLAQFGENVRQGVNFICNCCGCCCEAMLAIRRFGLTRPIHSNFIARVDAAACTGCGLCAAVCPVLAIAPPRPAPPDRPSSMPPCVSAAGFASAIARLPPSFSIPGRIGS